MSDIVDNRREKLVDTIGRILESTESARFAVGYFFVSGLTAVQDRLEDVKELRLLIGNTSNRETIEQMAEGYRRLEAVAGAAEEQLYQKGAEARRVAGLAAREQDRQLRPALESGAPDPTFRTHRPYRERAR